MDNFKPDILCLQETKCSQSKLPEELKVPGYHSFFSSGDTEGYAGTALYSKDKPKDVKLTNSIINGYVKFCYGVITRSNKTLSYCHLITITRQYFHSLYLVQRKYLRSALQIYSFSVWGLNTGIKARFNEPSPYVLNTHKLYFKTLHLYYVYPAHKSH